jgi:hypothetical protein
VLPPIRKETEYLTREYARGPGWYRAHFPLRIRGAVCSSIGGAGAVTFEATPDYLFHPLAPERAARDLSGIRLVVLLRDPVERAFSHYLHMVRLGFETLSFEDAIRSEPERIGPDLEALTTDPVNRTPQLLRFSYVSRGMYAEQITRWTEQHAPARLLVVESETFFRDTAGEYSRILRFLGLRAVLPASFPNLSSRAPDRPTMNLATRASLAARFRLPNEELFALIGRRMDWER